VRTAIIRYAPRAVGVNPSASQGEARLRGLRRIISSKTISPRLNPRPPACGGRGKRSRWWRCGSAPTPRVRGAWGEARLRGRERNNDSKTVFLTRWNRSCPCTAWERGRLARMPGSAGILPHLGARASRPHARDAGIPPRLGARASCPPGSAGILPRLGSRASRPHWERGHLALDAPRGRDVLALQGQVLGRRLRSLSRFGLQDAQTPPSSLVGEGGWGDEGQKRTGMQQTAHRSQERSP
jgi:hypothetical protein